MPYAAVSAVRFDRSQTFISVVPLARHRARKALGLKNVKLLGYDFAMLLDYTIVISLSCTHENLHPRSHSSAVTSKLDLLRTKSHGSPELFTPKISLSRYSGNP